MKRIKFFWRGFFPSSSFHHLLDIFGQLISFYLPHSSKAKECYFFFFFNGIVIIMTITQQCAQLRRERASEGKISKSIYYEMLKFIFSVNRLLTRRWCCFPIYFFYFFLSFLIYSRATIIFFPSIPNELNSYERDDGTERCRVSSHSGCHIILYPPFAQKQNK